MEPLNKEYDWRYRPFIYKGKKKPEITLEIKLEEKIPMFNKLNRVFTTIHPLSGDTNWSLFRKGNKFIIKQYVSQKNQCAILNKDFNKGTVYLLPDNSDKLTWDLTSIIYDLLQIVLINYLSREEGMFVHSVGLKDIDGKGLLFVGPTQSGKSTTARLWHNHSKAKVLNDDRMIVRKIDGRFFIFGTPWHGDFSDYLASRIDIAELKRIFLIYHNSKNTISHLKPKEAFRCLYPNIFPTFWNRDYLEKQINLCQNLIERVPSYRLGFKKDKSVISVVRSLR